MTAKYSPRLSARQTFSRWAISAALLLSVGAASATANPTTFYVATSGSNSNTGSQASPFLTINAAITAASTGDTVDITDGTYTGTGNVDLDTGGKSLIIQSVNGANSTIIDCGGSSSANHRGFYIHNGETVSITGLTVKNGYESSAFGGGVYSYNSSSVTLTNCTVSDNTTTNYGGAVYSVFGTLTLTNCTFSGNTATHYGNGVSSYSCPLTLTNCILYDDTASGGEIYNNGSTVTVASSDIQGGSAGTGNINTDPLFVSTTDFHLQSTSPCIGAGTSTGAPITDIEGNIRATPPNMGAYGVAAIHVPADYQTIQAAIDAANSGGNIEIADGIYTGIGNVDLDTAGKSLTFRSVHGAASTIIDCGGTSSASHRGFYVRSGETVSISGLTIKNGYESYDSSVPDSGYGGGVYSNSGSSLTLSNCKLIHNTSEYDGGGVFSRDSSLILRSCTVDSNTASDGNGGGVSYYTRTSGEIADLENCIIANNFSQSSGGGVCSYTTGSGTVSFANCLVANNTSYYDGGSLYAVGDQGGTTAVTNCTLTANTSLFGDGSGVYSYDNGGTSSYTNTIVYGNTGGEIWDATGTLTVASCDVQGGYTGMGNLDRDPLFVSTTDFHLLPGSPCFAAGTSNGEPTTDLDGITRPATPTIGAYEGTPALVTLTSITLTQASPSVIVGATDQFTATATYSDGSTVDVTSTAIWASDNSAVTINSAGLATGFAAGSANITAAFNGVTSSAAALTVTAVSVPVVSGYQALWSASNGTFSVWNVALGGGFAPHDFDATPGYTAQAVADTPDGHVHVLLTAADGSVKFDDAVISGLTRDHNSSTQLSYGPFAGWTAKTIAAGPDGLQRVLWTRTDGMVSLWKLQASGTYTHDEYGPYAGWSARLMTVASDSTVRLVWTNTDGQMSFWVMDASGGYTHAEYGAYPGWTPTALTASASGINLVSWTHSGDGKLSLWALQDSGQFVFADFGPFAGWTASSLTVGADSTLHVGWTQASGMASLWDLSGTAFQFSVYGPYSAWHLQGQAAAP